jgi:ribosomal protein S18 acetylase RimI-like enzyme
MIPSFFISGASRMSHSRASQAKCLSFALKINQGNINMGRRGRFGKYGESKRLERLRQSGVYDPSHKAAKVHPAEEGSFSKKWVPQSDRIRVVAAKAADIDFVERLSEIAFRKYGSYQRVITQWFQSEMTETIIGHMGGRPVGFAMIGMIKDETSAQDICEILAIAVTPTKQHKGIGHLLLRAVEKKASEWPVERIFLHTAKDNIAARDLFTKHGYVSSGMKTNFYPEGQDALLMSKIIQPHLFPKHTSVKSRRLGGKKRKHSNF